MNIMDQVMQFVEPSRQFVKDSIRLVKRCTKPDRKEFQKIAMATAIGFAIMGFIGFFVKLIHIPINNIIVKSWTRTNSNFNSWGQKMVMQCKVLVGWLPGVSRGNRFVGVGGAHQLPKLQDLDLEEWKRMREGGNKREGGREAVHCHLFSTGQSKDNGMHNSRGNERGSSDWNEAAPVPPRPVFTSSLWLPCQHSMNINYPGQTIEGQFFSSYIFIFYSNATSASAFISRWRIGAALTNELNLPSLKWKQKKEKKSFEKVQKMKTRTWRVVFLRYNMYSSQQLFPSLIQSPRAVSGPADRLKPDRVAGQRRCQGLTTVTGKQTNTITHTHYTSRFSRGRTNTQRLFKGRVNISRAADKRKKVHRREGQKLAPLRTKKNGNTGINKTQIRWMYIYVDNKTQAEIRDRGWREVYISVLVWLSDAVLLNNVEVPVTGPKLQHAGKQPCSASVSFPLHILSLPPETHQLYNYTQTPTLFPIPASPPLSPSLAMFSVSLSSIYAELFTVSDKSLKDRLKLSHCSAP
ncbi:hypothetical protein F7725_028580 [Dissostichus mawsoni]|uniref:Protein transport protein Sec61 subunit gamma n=3 Tax=Euteleostomi TaxID=117571 RepID=A0A7J5XG29_DISMA|nr:hypothetical protein F7725_028580 [Dissostichus mawsoni]